MTTINLWTHVLEGSTHGNRDLVVILLELLSDPKVNYSQIVVIFRADKDNIERLDVKVEDPLAVDKLDSSDNLSNEHLALSLRQTIVVRGGPGDQIPASEVFCHQHGVERSFVEANQLHHKGGLNEGT